MSASPSLGWGPAWSVLWAGLGWVGRVGPALGVSRPLLWVRRPQLTKVGDVGAQSPQQVPRSAGWAGWFRSQQWGGTWV